MKDYTTLNLTLNDPLTNNHYSVNRKYEGFNKVEQTRSKPCEKLLLEEITCQSHDTNSYNVKDYPELQ